MAQTICELHSRRNPGTVFWFVLRPLASFEEIVGATGWPPARKKRAEYIPQQTPLIEPYQLRNQMVVRVMAQILMLQLLRIPWILEQPSSSVMEHHPMFAWICSKFCVYRATWL